MGGLADKMPFYPFMAVKGYAMVLVGIFKKLSLS
jgi:hypothetical protein